MRLSIDTGGTFTDLVVEDDSGRLAIYKSPTTPNDPLQGILNVVDRAADAMQLSREGLLRATGTLIHGTTRATNAILTHTTAKTAFITTKGHPDVLTLRMGGRSDAFNHTREYPEAYVPRELTFEVDERIDYNGTVVSELQEASVQSIAAALAELHVEAAGVCLLWSIANGAHELQVRELLLGQLPGLQITLSHQLSPVIREYYRASAACIDASLKPLMTQYLQGLRAALGANGFGGRLLVASVAGGLLEPEWLANAPIHSINSGPAMAPAAGLYYAQADSDRPTAVVIDTGGTSFDVSVIRDGHIPRTKEMWLGERHTGHATGLPSIDVRTTGAGGGSIARVDSGGLLRVGPDSAGAVPGPVCYGLGGTLVTVTDAAMVLGYLDPARLAQFGISVATKSAAEAIASQIGEPLGLDLHSAAEAVIRVVTEHMVHAIEEVTVEQGIDPRSAVLVAGGGAAGFNIVSIAARLGCTQLLVPQACAALSAVGGLMCDVAVEYASAMYTETSQFDCDAVNSVLEGLETRCSDAMSNSGSAERERRTEFLADARYVGQVWEIELPLRRSRFSTLGDVELLREDFHTLHEQIFAVRDPNSPIEIVGWRARVSSPVERPLELQLHAELEPRISDERKIFVRGEGLRPVPVWSSSSLAEGKSLSGPALLELPGTTVLLEPGWVARRAPTGTIAISPSQRINRYASGVEVTDVAHR